VFTPTIPFTFDTTTGNATISGDLLVGGEITSSSINVHSGDFQVDAATGAVLAAKFVGSNSNFSNAFNPTTPALTATTTTGAAQPAIKAVGAVGCHAIEADGSISATRTGLGSTITGTATTGVGVHGTSNNAAGYGVYAGNTGGGYALFCGAKAYVNGTLEVTSTITGNLTGNVTGNVSGSSGSCTGNAATATTAAACSGNAATATSATSATYATRSGEVYNSGNCYMYSSSATYSCALQTDGNLVVRQGSTVLWSWLYGPSDRRLKKNIRSTHASGTDIINALRVVDFKWKVGAGRNDERRHTGFIAQEVAEVIPTAVGDIGGIKGVNSDALIPFLVKAVQELSQQIEELRSAR
jgi:hypothetical protein